MAARKKKAGAAKAAAEATKFNHAKRVDEATGGVFSTLKSYLKNSGMVTPKSKKKKK